MKRYVLFILLIEYCYCLLDPISLGLGGALLGFGGYNYDTIKKYSYCKIYECCINEHIPADINGLESELKEHIFGQHILIEQLIPALRGHFYTHTKSKKPLVISFHGTPGTGKNYVSDFVAKKLYKKGIKSQYVHKFMGRADFPVESKVSQYKEIVNTKIRDALSKCPRSLFIFDEVEKMPSGIFDAITSFLDHNYHVNGVDYSKSTFLLLSNSAGVELSDQLGALLKYGAQREDTKLQDFESILELGAYNLVGGLQNANIIEAHLIDHYIPFLPLEKHHVRECILAEYKRFNINPSQESIDNLLDNFTTYDPTYGLFSKMGCKRLSKKIEVDVMSRYLDHNLS